ncbi:phage baseplate plug protein [Pseudomonas sp. CJQ_7]|uniref:phage baseplate plug family protein n=1 Tax=Pseudomonas sp. CJQ_7 TaxID=3367166 RepID=UPI00370B0DEA
MITIPLTAGVGNAHQRFSVQLGDNLISFEIDFISYLDAPAWSMNLIRGGVRLVSGAMLEPGSDVIQSYRTGIGQLVFTGKDVTLDNLGIENSLVWIPPLEEI